ncbi:DUF3300 domain-containing protein [Marinimicrobium sp. ABcell2]|uniref:DUF3300 domain-containing protein n=1 Tax=Marinimicrobium sp. ABcell2 TaxID=3069751 RepID=UPI0027B0DA7C|nr:DUF3300 domain-containing protein [Marinimicrobium sp. ABcell2]MDQ2075955.1 DUF3300 domain-containing protein [Marinimicrobium sp. ABcell2]
MKNILVFVGLLLLAAPLHYVWGEDEGPVFTQAEIEQMLAPIALYPDTVLSHILIAATYPLEVVQAERWTQRNSDLEGAEAVAAVEDQDWDPSVKALVAFPQILERMSEDLDWTQDLGDAFLLDEERVLAGVQELRQRAYAQGNLKTTEYVEVVREPDTIIIESRTREVVYIPYYDTRVVYGAWHWPGYYPVYWHRPSHYYWHSGFYWGPGVRVHHGFYFSSFHWGQRRTVVIHNHHYQPPTRYYTGRTIARHERAQHWRHDPYHRRGVEYRQRPDQRRVEVHRNEGQPARLDRRRGTQSEYVRPSRPQASETRERLSSPTPRPDAQRAPGRVSGAERSQRPERGGDVRSTQRTADPRQPSQQRPDRSDRSSGAEVRRSQPSEPARPMRQQRTQPERTQPEPSAAPQRQEQTPQRTQRQSRQPSPQSSGGRRDSSAAPAPRSDRSSSPRRERQNSRTRRGD